MLLTLRQIRPPPRIILSQLPNYFKRMGSTEMSSDTIVEVIITDPSYIKTASNYEENITIDQRAGPENKSPSNYVKVPISRILFDSLHGHMKTHLLPGPGTDEMMIILGENYPFKKYEYLGSHTSDSGLTCIIRLDAYTSEMDNSIEQADLEVDWLELVTLSLEGSPIDLEDFPLLKFCAGIPDGESAVAVYGIKDHVNPLGFKSLVLRSWSQAFSQTSSLSDVNSNYNCTSYK